MAANSQLLVHLQDVNDNSPVFQPEEYAVLLTSDGLDPSLPLLRVRAIDLDASANFSNINYELGEGVGTELFWMDSKTGELRLSEQGARKFGKMGGDDEEKAMYGLELRVDAIDQGGKSSEQMVCK